MENLRDVFFSFTYGGDCIGLSAAKACIPKIKEKEVVKPSGCFCVAFFRIVSKTLLVLVVSSTC